MNNTIYKRNLKEILHDILENKMEPYWFITYHYKENKTNEEEVLMDVRDIKNKLKRVIYQNRDKTITGMGEYYYPRIVFINEKSRCGTDQYHTHMVIEKLPTTINTQAAVERIIKQILPQKSRSVSKWKRIDVQRVSTERSDIHRLSRYLTKQNTLDFLSLDPFNSDL